MKIEHRFRFSKEAARKFYEEAFDNPPEHEYLYYDALNYIDDGLYKEAEECIDKAIELCTDNPFYIEVKNDLLKRRSGNVNIYKSSCQEEEEEEDYKKEDNKNSIFFVIAVIAACIGCFFWWYNSSQKEKSDMEVVSDTIESDTIAAEEIEEDYGTFPTNPEAFIGDGQCFDLRGHAMCTEDMDFILGPDGRIMVKPQEEEDSLGTPDELTDIKRNVKGKLISFDFKNSDYWYSGDFVYNKDGLVERIQIDYVRSGDKTVLTYNEQGYIIHAAYSDYGISIGEGKVVETKSQYKYKYKEFDSHGNWIQRICIDEKGKESVETRDITYY